MLEEWNEDRLNKPDFSDAFLQLNIALSSEIRKDIAGVER